LDTFYISRYPVTVAQFDRFLEANLRYVRPCGTVLPLF
jgi:formylglycine-generating enzyme required for sulfatase activity